LADLIQNVKALADCKTEDTAESLQADCETEDTAESLQADCETEDTAESLQADCETEDTAESLQIDSRVAYNKALVKKEFEVVKNEIFITWLKQNIKRVSKTVQVYSDEASKHSYCRFSGSREDFKCYVRLDSQSISVSMQSERVMEEVEESGFSGDCKNYFDESDKNQVLANMMKTAADITVDAVENNKLPSIVTVAGVLVDNKKERVVKIYKLILDYASNKTILYKCDEADLRIEEAFSRLLSDLLGQ
jgi:hypothetical protein